jgi:hypothetical protein
VTHATDYVTVSNSFSHHHWKRSLVGHSDSNKSENQSHLTVTCNIRRSPGKTLVARYSVRPFQAIILSIPNQVVTIVFCLRRYTRSCIGLFLLLGAASLSPHRQMLDPAKARLGRLWRYNCCLDPCSLIRILFPALPESSQARARYYARLSFSADFFTTLPDAQPSHCNICPLPPIPSSLRQHSSRHDRLLRSSTRDDKQRLRLYQSAHAPCA